MVGLRHDHFQQGLFDRPHQHLMHAARFGAAMDPKTNLQELAARLGIGLPSYQVTDSGPDHSKRFHAKVLLSGKVIASGDGSSKKQAEMAAALDAFVKLKSE